jgi:hypothetical protein
MQASDDEVQRLAKLWFERHGDVAVSLARDMASEMQQSGNLAGADMWLRVIVALQELGKPGVR